jgi:hypothetical protein
MSQNTFVLRIPGDCLTLSALLTRSLEKSGYRVVRSFDLQRVRTVHSNCECPHHSTTECDCQMVVLLVYLSNGELITLTAHGRDGITHLDLHEEVPTNKEIALLRIINEVFTQLNPSRKNEVSTSV